MTSLWNQKGIDREDDFERPWYKSAIRLLSTIIQSDMNIVELGCGRGEFARSINQNNVNYLGLDGNYSNTLAAKEKGIFVCESNFEDTVPVEKESVDIVVTLEVIEHIANAEAYLSEIITILKPGGYLLLSTPNVGFVGARLRYLLWADVQQEGIHLRFFNKSKLLTITSLAGFDFIQQLSFMPLLVYNTLARLLQSKSKRKYILVPRFLENWWALHFVWLLKKKE